MMLVLALLAIVGAEAHSAHFAPKTHSAVCPAIDYDQGWAEVRPNLYMIKFKPRNPNLDFKFVDVHIALETDQGELVGVVKNYAMKRPHGKSEWVAEVRNQGHVAALKSRRADRVLKYSFTYCVGINGEAVDCDTDVYAIERFEWRAEPFPACPEDCGRGPSMLKRPVGCFVEGTNKERPSSSCDPEAKPRSSMSCQATEDCVTYSSRQALVECPTECGLEASKHPIPSTCWGSDGEVYPQEMCGGEQGYQMCPPTPPCVTFYWDAEPVQCPTECGLPASTIKPEAICMGDDGSEYPDAHCANEPMPEAKFCPKTKECVSFFWEALPAECPTECGLTASRVQQEAICRGSDGQEYPDAHCANEPMPEAKFCPATEDCVSFFWEPLPVECPTECGLKASGVRPEAICMGTDGREHSAERCTNEAYPSHVMCPKTADCVTYSWRAGLMAECPTECGLPASTIPRKATCVGSDLSYPPASYCTQEPPAAQQCPETEPCPLSPYCHPIEFDQRVTKIGSSLMLTFIPLGKDIRKHHLEWVDVHFTIEDGLGNAVPGGELSNHRMTKPGKMDADFVFTYMIDSPHAISAMLPGRQLVYYFTYCINMIDCDTHKYLFTIPAH